MVFKVDILSHKKIFKDNNEKKPLEEPRAIGRYMLIDRSLLYLFEIYIGYLFAFFN